MKVLMCGTSKMGGVSQFCNAMARYSPDQIDVFTIGKRSSHEQFLSSVSRLASDFIRYKRKLNGGHYDLVHLNPSLDFKALARDGVFLLMASHLHIRTVVFFHGWKHHVENKLRRYGLIIFHWIYSHATAMVVLAEEFRRTLREMGFRCPVYRMSTSVEDELLLQVSEDSIRCRVADARAAWNILFLGRVERAKGIYEVLETQKLLQDEYPGLSLTIAGDGDELDSARHYVNFRNIKRVEFAGHVDGVRKVELLQRADIFLLPSYSEAMPVSLLEAMASGVPVVSRPLGGLKDFFRNDVMGYLTESLDPNVFAEIIRTLIARPSKRLAIGLYNYRFAREHFGTTKVAGRLIQIYEECCCG